MKGVLYIDGVDVYEAYGVSVSDAAYDDLVCLPSLKDIPFNDWHEKNGIDPDLSSPVVAPMTISIPFHIIGSYSHYMAFIAAITADAYHIFNFAAISLKKELRLVSCGEPRSTYDLIAFSLTFADDNPTSGYTYLAPNSEMQKLGDYLLDGVDMASYGVRILKGTLDSIKKAPDVKENLRRDLATISGALYDGSIVTYQSKTASIHCLMKAGDAIEFWRNRNALLYDLTKPDSRILSVTELGKDIPCFYKGCSVACFYPDGGRYWFEFTLNLEFFNGVI